MTFNKLLIAGCVTLILHSNSVAQDNANEEPLVTINWNEEAEKSLPSQVAAQSPTQSTHTETYSAGPIVPKVGALGVVPIKLLAVNGYPEFKTEWEQQCVGSGRFRVCTDIPVVYRRNCDLVIYADIHHPDAETLGNDIAQCVRAAMAAGIITGIITENPQAAALALQSYLVACLEQKGIERASEVSVSLRKESECGGWNRSS